MSGSASTFWLIENFCKRIRGLPARQMRQRDVKGYEEIFFETMKRNRNPPAPNVP